MNVLRFSFPRGCFLFPLESAFFGKVVALVDVYGPLGFYAASFSRVLSLY